MKNIISKFKVGQLLNCRKNYYSSLKEEMVLTTGLPAADVRFPKEYWPEGFDPYGNFYGWMVIVSIEGSTIIVRQAEKSELAITSQRGSVYLGRVFNINESGCLVNISPSLHVVVKKEKAEGYEEYSKGILVCVLVDWVTEKTCFGRIVCTEKSDAGMELPDVFSGFEKKKPSKNTALEPKKDLPKVIFIPAAMEDMLRELELPKTQENIDKIDKMFKEEYAKAFAEERFIKDFNLKGSRNEDAAHYSFESEIFVDRPLGKAPLTFGFKTKLDEDAYIVERCGLKTKNLHMVLESDVYAKSWDDVINDLAKMALKENWGEPKKRGKSEVKNPILHSYFVFTYYVAKTQGKVLRKELGIDNLTIFNTGLVDSTYEYIYAVMEDSGEKHKQKLEFLGFAVVGRGILGKRISKLFDVLPERVEYIHDANELFLDTKAAMYDCDIDIEHLVSPARLARLPERFLRYVCAMDDKATEILQRKDTGKWAALVERFNDKDTNLKFRLSEEIRASKDIAVKRTEWNYKTAIPIYFAARHTISTIIPLTLPYTDVETGRVDAALVLSHNKESGRYQAETILTLDMAYANSRQIARPDSDWLLVPKMEEEWEED